jgi:succinate dehydrogenase/fumarate reductase cytochrome b subunit
MNIQSYLVEIGKFGDNIIVPFLLALAGLMFMWNAFRYFILGGANEESQAKARTLALWGIIAFVLILSLWGIVNLLVEGFGFDGSSGEPLVPDYMDR